MKDTKSDVSKSSMNSLKEQPNKDLKFKRKQKNSNTKKRFIKKTNWAKTID